MTSHLNLHDRINVIGAPVVKDICTRAHDLGIDAVAIGQHENGGFFEPKFIDPVKDVLQHCRSIGLKVIMRVHDVSKCDYNNPAGWPLQPFKSHRPIRTKWTHDSRGTSSTLRVNLLGHQVYVLQYTSATPGTLFVFKDGHQLGKFPTGISNTHEFVSHYGAGIYDLVFQYVIQVTDKNKQVLLHELCSVRRDNEAAIYLGAKGISGHWHALTTNHADRARRAEDYKITVGRIDNLYREFADNIFATIADADEFSACGGQYRATDLLRSLEDLALLSKVMWDVPLFAWMRPGDWDTHPGHANYPDPIRPLVFEEACTIPNLIPIAWAEKTTPELCQEMFKQVPTGFAGVYLTESTPEHFTEAGFEEFSAFWWPKSGQSYKDHFPYPELEATVKAFA